MIEELCGVINCKQTAAGKVWQVPICDFHWKECCARDKGCSVPWLRRNVRSDYRTQFEQYSTRTDKLFRLAHKLELSATSLNNKARHTVLYTEKHLSDHTELIDEALHKVAKIESWVNELSHKIEDAIREIDGELDAEFHRIAKREAMKLSAESLSFTHSKPREKREHKPKEPAKPKFNLMAVLGKKK